MVRQWLPYQVAGAVPLPLRGRHSQADWADVDSSVSDSCDCGCHGNQGRGDAHSHGAAHSHMNSHQ